jgi:Kef-type K+ transport system membrane component KefB
MVLGFVLVNSMPHPERWFEAVEGIEEPVFGIFFVLAGAHLKIDALVAAGWLAAIIIVGRSAAKIIGAYAGGVLSGAPAVVNRNLPMGLLPQAGVSIGLVLAAEGIVGNQAAAEIMVNAVLASVIVNELFSPLLVRHALIKAGEIRKTGEIA